MLTDMLHRGGKDRWLTPILLLAALQGAAAAEPNTALPVAAVKVARETMAEEVAFQAEFRPYTEVVLHAKVAGYLESITVDAGDAVKAGQVIATLEIPELQSELEHAEAAERHAQAEVERAQAAYEEAHLAYTRLATANDQQPQLIAPQDLDTAKARDHVAEAALTAARQQVEVANADVDKVKVMKDYTKVTAPFSGVITKRFVDPGALIQAGTSSDTMPLARLSENAKLRLVFPVSLSYVSRIKLGDPVEIRVPSLSRTVKGAISRFTRRVETATRTMEVEVDVLNEDLAITPGVYATAVVKLESHEGALAVPVEAVSRDKNGATAMVVNGNNIVEERTLVVGAESPTRLEVISGLAENERVVVGNRSQIRAGQEVAPKLVELPKVE